MTIESSGAPGVKCEFENGQSTRYLRMQDGAFLCPPGGKITDITLTGRVKGGGLCSKSSDGPPKDEYLRVAKSELVPVWRASVEEVFDVSSEEGLSFDVITPRLSFVEAFIDGTQATTGLSVSSYSGNSHFVSLDGGTGSNRRYATVRVRATVFGVCTKDCAKPADEELKIARTH